MVQFFTRKKLNFPQMNSRFKNPKVCLFVWQSIGSAPGHDRVLRPVSLEPLWPKVETFEKNFLEKWPVAKLPQSNVTPLMLFYGKSCK